MIHISNLNKTFGSSKGLSHINLHVAPGEMVALIGSSGPENPRSCATSAV